MDYIFPSLLVVMSVWLVVDILIKISHTVSEIKQRQRALESFESTMDTALESFLTKKTRATRKIPKE